MAVPRNPRDRDYPDYGDASDVIPGYYPTATPTPRQTALPRPPDPAARPAKDTAPDQYAHADPRADPHPRAHPDQGADADADAGPDRPGIQGRHDHHPRHQAVRDRRGPLEDDHADRLLAR